MMRTLQRADGFLALAAPRDAPAVQEKPGLWEPWQWLCLGAWWLRGTWHVELETVRVPQVSWNTSRISGWLCTMVNLYGFSAASKRRTGREAGMRGKGSALIKLTVLLMSLWTQPLSFPLPAATSIIRCRGRRRECCCSQCCWQYLDENLVL